MLKIVTIVSNIMGLKAKPPNSIQFYSITPKLDIISIQMYTINVTLNPTASPIRRISNETISLNSIETREKTPFVPSSQRKPFEQNIVICAAALQRQRKLSQRSRLIPFFFKHASLTR